MLFDHCTRPTIASCQNIVVQGSTSGDALTTVALPQLDKCWDMTAAEKNQLYGDNRPMPGGRVEGDDGGVRRKRRTLTDVEPVTYWGSTLELYKELIHRAGPAKAVIDLTVVDHNCASACLTMQVPYLGVCMTETHSTKLDVRIKQWLFNQMQVENTFCFRPALVDFLSATAEDPKLAEPKKAEKAKAKGKAKSGNKDVLGAIAAALGSGSTDGAEVEELADSDSEAA